MDNDDFEVPETEVELEAPVQDMDTELDVEPEEDEHQPGGRVQRLANERRQFKEELERERARREEYERMLHEAMLRQQGAPVQEEGDEMTRWTKRVEQTMQQNMFQQQDMMDKTRFEIKAESNPLFKRYAGKVEEQLAQMRRNGSNAPRETILAYLVGQEALTGQLKKPKAKTAPKEAQPAGMKSTVSPQKSEPSLKERLSNVRL